MGRGTNITSGQDILYGHVGSRNMSGTDLEFDYLINQDLEKIDRGEYDDLIWIDYNVTLSMRTHEDEILNSLQSTGFVSVWSSRKHHAEQVSIVEGQVHYLATKQLGIEEPELITESRSYGKYYVIACKIA